MAKKKAHKTKKRGLKGPLAIIPSVGVATSATGAAQRINADTNNSLSWIAIAGVAFIGYQALKLFGKTATAAGDIIGAVGDGVTTDPNAGGGNMGNTNGNNPNGATINTAQAQTIASQLASIFNGLWGLNDNERQKVYALLSGKNVEDYKLISAAFGMPRRNIITGEMGLPLTGPQLNLTQWLVEEMGSEGMAKLKQITINIF